MDRSSARAAALFHQGQSLTLARRWSGCTDGPPGSGTDEQTGRAGVTSGAARRAGPRLLNPELGSDKCLSGGRGRGRAGRGQSWAGPGRPLPLQRQSQTLSEWRGPAGAGRTGAGELGAGQWQSGAPAPSLGIGEIWARGGA